MKRQFLIILATAVTCACIVVGCKDDSQVTAPTIEPPRSFVYPSGKGTTWVYSNRFLRVVHWGYSYTREDRWGIQTWEVDSSTPSGSDTVVLIAVANRDSIHVLSWEELPPGGPRDTTINSTTVRDTSGSVTLSLKRDSLSIDLSTALFKWVWFHANESQFSRLLTSETDTVTKGNYVFVHGTGLVYWHDGVYGITAWATDTLTLVGR